MGLPIHVTSRGRIRRRALWAGVAILFVASLLIGLAQSAFGPAIGVALGVLQLGLVYVWICLLLRRMHDLGRGWITLLVFLGVATLFWAEILNLRSVLRGMIASGVSDTGYLWSAALTGVFAPLHLLRGFAFAIFTSMLWLGVASGRKGANRYGPQPGVPDQVEVF